MGVGLLSLVSQMAYPGVTCTFLPPGSDVLGSGQFPHEKGKDES